MYEIPNTGGGDYQRYEYQFFTNDLRKNPMSKHKTGIQDTINRGA